LVVFPDLRRRDAGRLLPWNAAPSVRTVLEFLREAGKTVAATATASVCSERFV
jgi:hypothetical protein